MKPLTFTLLLFALLLCVACGQSAAKELNGTGSPVPDTSAIITAVERNLATMDEMPHDNIEDDNRYDLAVDLLDTLVDLVNIHHVEYSKKITSPYFKKETPWYNAIVAYKGVSNEGMKKANLVWSLYQTGKHPYSPSKNLF